MDENLKIIDGARKYSMEVLMHCAIYRARQDVFGVTHTHYIFATAWACCEMGIPCIVPEVSGLVGGSVKCAPNKDAVYRRIGGDCC